MRRRLNLVTLLFLSFVCLLVEGQGLTQEPRSTGGQRTLWFNRTYGLNLKKINDKEWHEIEIKNGKVWTKLTYIGEVDNYVELWNTPRNSPKRLFKDHCEDLENGKWVVTASGEWKVNDESPANDGIENSDSEIPKEWTAATEKYLREIERSIDSVLDQIDLRESEIRKAGDLEKLEKVKKARNAFAEKGEIPPSINRELYKSLRGAALEELTQMKSKLILVLLEKKKDALANQLETEFIELSDPLHADLQARWAVAVREYYLEVEAAKQLVVEKIDQLEKQARENALLGEVESAKKARKLFLEGDIMPAMSPTFLASFNSKLKAAKNKLEQVNKSLVSALLIAEKDAQAREMLDRFEGVTRTKGKKP